MSERESNERALGHGILTVGHVLERRLLVVHFLVLGHVGLVVEVVEVAGVGLRIQLGDEGRTLLADRWPVDFGKVGVCVDSLDGRETLGFRGDKTVVISFVDLFKEGVSMTYLVMKAQVRLLIK